MNGGGDFAVDVALEPRPQDNSFSMVTRTIRSVDSHNCFGAVMIKQSRPERQIERVARGGPR